MNDLAVLLLAFAGFTAICLSMTKHQPETLGRKLEPTRQLQARISGWIALTLAYGCAVAGGGWKFGSVQWVGAIMLCALILVAILLPYRPRWAPRAGLGAAALGLLAAAFGLAN